MVRKGLAASSSLEVDYEIELLWPLYRQVAWLGTVQDFPDVTRASLPDRGYVRPVSNETAGFWKLRQWQ